MQLKVENRFQRSSDYLYLINKLVVQNENFQEAKQNDYGKPTELLNLLIFLSRWENKSESMDRGNWMWSRVQPHPDMNWKIGQSSVKLYIL